MGTATKKFPRGVEVVCCAVIENAKGEILLTRSPKWRDKWTLPGGHVDPGETVFQAIVREVQEEVGIAVEPVTILVWGELINSKEFDRPAHLIFADTYCRQKKSAPLALDPRELTEHVWVAPQQALKMDLVETFDQTINKLISYKSRS